MLRQNNHNLGLIRCTSKLTLKNSMVRTIITEHEAVITRKEQQEEIYQENRINNTI